MSAVTGTSVCFLRMEICKEVEDEILNRVPVFSIEGRAKSVGSRAGENVHTVVGIDYFLLSEGGIEVTKLGQG